MLLAMRSRLSLLVLGPVEDKAARRPRLLPRSGEHGCGCSAQNLGVQLQRPAADVFQIEAHPLVKIVYLVAAAYLPQAGDARLDRQLLFLKIGEAPIFALQGWTRTHQAHVPLQNATKLGQFVKTVAPHPAAGRSDARVFGYLED